MTAAQFIHDLETDTHYCPACGDSVPTPGFCAECEKEELTNQTITGEIL
jgi:hypothetical protein